MAVEQGIGRYDLERLGERVVKAARLAVAVHLFESLWPHASDARAASPGSEQQRAIGQQVAIGGAGPYFVTEDEPPVLPPAAGRSTRPSRVPGGRPRPLGGGAPIPGTDFTADDDDAEAGQ